METFQTIQVSIPLWQIVLLGVISLACIISARLKLGLLATFIFAVYWGLMKQFSQEGNNIMSFQFFDALYLFIGLSIATVFVIYLFFMTNE